MACAPDGQRRPGLAQAADLIRGGLWMRLRPSVPRSARTVRAAVRVMCAGAAVSTANLITVLAFIADVKIYHAVLGHRLTAAQVSQVNTLFITLTIGFDLVPVALWLWMARASGQGRNWARGLSTALFGVATLEMINAIGGPGVVFGATVFSPAIPVLTWLVGLAAVWLLWLPASSAFFKPQGSEWVPPARPKPPGWPVSGQPPRLLSVTMTGTLSARQAARAGLRCGGNG
jgi:hypothetical protein